MIEYIFEDIKNGATLEDMYNSYGGIEIYIPKKSPNYKEKIIKEFNGYNYSQLAYKYNTTVTNVRKILKSVK